MFKSDSYYVRLVEEIKHTENYLKIQELRFPDGFSYSIELSEDIKNAKIPPLVIQSLVENSIKHALIIGDPIHISTKVIAKESNLVIIISDTGIGFPSEILYKLNNKEKLNMNDNTRIGIWNTIKRLELLYGEENINVCFKNKSDGGALIEITIPFEC